MLAHTVSCDHWAFQQFLELLSIHPSATYPNQGRGGLERIPAVIGQLNKVPVCHKVDTEKKQSFTLIPMANLPWR